MTNSSRGRSYIGVVRFAREWDFGLGIEGSYTRSDVTDENAITSTTAGSLYNNNVFNVPNAAAYGRSIYEITDQWKFGVNFRHEFIEGATTRFGLFGEYRSGRPYSITMFDTTANRSAVFGTVGTASRHLLYVPTVGDTRVSFDNATSEANFNTLVSNMGLERFRGRILPKNSQTSPDFVRLDLHVSQEIPTFVSSARIELFADIENVLNLINRDWGALRQVSFPYAATVVNVACLTTPTATGTAPAAGVVNTLPTQNCAQYRYSNVVNPNVDLVTRQSLYGIRVGARIRF
jgi:hypothetical protein